MFYLDLNNLLEKYNNAMVGQSTIKKGKKIVGVLTKFIKPIDNNIKQEIIDMGYPVEFYTTQSQYAPEIKSSAVLLLSKAEVKRRKHEQKTV